jgi:flagellar hook-associated protein 1 FlgK
VTSDTSQTTAGGASATALFGLDPSVRAARASSFTIRSDIASDPTKLAMAQLDLTATAGSSALSKGDARGALLLASAGDTTTTFDPAGPLGTVTATLAQYGAQFSGDVAQKSNAADASKSNATAVASEASTRRASVEGVNLDEELIKLTTYQQSYNASARMIQAVKDMYDTLLQMVP